MTKLDWSRSGLQQSDPARVQRVADFVEPDNVIVSVVPLSPAEIAKMNAALIKERKENAARLAAVKRAKLQAEKRAQLKRLLAVNKGKKQRLHKVKTADEHRKDGVRKQAAIKVNEENQLKKAEHLAKQKAKAERVAEFARERQEALRDRKTLNREWRAMLLKPE